MYLKKPTTAFTESYSAQIKQLKKELETADAIAIGAGAGMSTSAGMSYNGERFEKNFSDFRQKYGITDMYAGGFYPFDTLEEYWAWWARHVYLNRYAAAPGKPYLDLLALIGDKDYFVLTTNVDHQFQLAGFNKKRLFYTQGDYGLWQCSKACHEKTYDNQTQIGQMVAAQKDMKIPSELVPYCPVCGAPMTMNLRVDHNFVQDQGWYAAANRYDSFIRCHRDLHILFLELGVGGNTPMIIKYPFWQMTAENSKAVYACINSGQAIGPNEIARQAIYINGDIGEVLSELNPKRKNGD